jgi:hypothetical protein
MGAPANSSRKVSVLRKSDPEFLKTPFFMRRLVQHMKTKM